MNKKKVIILICGLMVVLCVGVLSYFRMYITEETFVSEVGSSLEQEVSAYAKGYTSGAVVDLSNVNTEKTGTYEATVKGTFQTLEFHIEVKDMLAPTADALKNQSFLTNESISAESLITKLSDTSPVTITFEDGSDSLNFSEGGQYVEKVLLTDSSGNKASLKVEFNVIADITKPIFEGIADKSIYEGDTIEYLKNVTATDDRDGNLTEAILVDATSVKLDTPGEYEIAYSVSDKSGNLSVEKAQVIVKDDKKPVLNSISDKSIYVGTDVNYLEGVTATDDRDGDLTSKIKVNSTKVDISKKGSYKVVYTVTDSFGNKTKKVAIINVKVKEITSKSSTSTSKTDKSSDKSSSDKSNSDDSGSTSGFQFFDVAPEGKQPNGDVPAGGKQDVGTWN